jgi:hypothetical protein
MGPYRSAACNRRHIRKRFRANPQHHQSIKAHGNACACGQTVLQSRYERLVHCHGWQPTLLSYFTVSFEPLTMLLDIQQLPVTVGDFNAVNDQFESRCGLAVWVYAR